MKRLLLVAALLPAVAHAAPTDAAKADIIKAVRAGMASKEAMRAAIRERDASSSPESELSYWTAARTAQSEMKAQFDLAIRLTQEQFSTRFTTPASPDYWRASSTTRPFITWT